MILEKKFLQKETNKLKNLNSHLDYRLEQQEKRLGTVTIELNKTWNLVGRMQVNSFQVYLRTNCMKFFFCFTSSTEATPTITYPRTSSTVSVATETSLDE